LLRYYVLLLYRRCASITRGARLSRALAYKLRYLKRNRASTPLEEEVKKDTFNAK
jgi:hypothetical protein